MRISAHLYLTAMVSYVDLTNQWEYCQPFRVVTCHSTTAIEQAEHAKLMVYMLHIKNMCTIWVMSTMDTLKVLISDSVEEHFRRKVSTRRGFRKRALSAAASAIAKYSGLDPKLSASVIFDNVLIDGDPALVREIASKILSPTEYRVFVPEESLNDENISVTAERQEDYMIFFADKEKLLSMLGATESVRAEFDDRELIYEEGDLLLTTQSFEEAKEYVGKSCSDHGG